ncbi:hypothetical protein G7Z17_g12680 [Cylindrodendrum hubeiense]|uniref:Ankyrin n=1 Tax=Cylindrodendrum hubeiense TaxID=595255 RepID=A0A9P5GV28_9HYPO|nr:hypothetical protein G7Z17_g12680 [Cylindrodendrum hubeiense]
MGFSKRLWGCAFDQRDDSELTPILFASEFGHEGVVKLLLQAGADFDQKDDDWGRTPISWASGRGHKSVVELLLEAGADFNQKDDSGRTPIAWAPKEGYESMVQLLLQLSAICGVLSCSRRSAVACSVVVAVRHPTPPQIPLSARRDPTFGPTKPESRNRRGLLSRTTPPLLPSRPKISSPPHRFHPPQVARPAIMSQRMKDMMQKGKDMGKEKGTALRNVKPKGTIRNKAVSGISPARLSLARPDS